MHEDHPSIAFACPFCKAPAGVACKTKFGKESPFIHHKRMDVYASARPSTVTEVAIRVRP